MKRETLQPLCIALRCFVARNNFRPEESATAWFSNMRSSVVIAARSPSCCLFSAQIATEIHDVRDGTFLPRAIQKTFRECFRILLRTRLYNKSDIPCHHLSITHTSTIQRPATFRTLGRFNWYLAAPSIGKRPDQMIVAAWFCDKNSDATFLKLVNRNFGSFIERELDSAIVIHSIFPSNSIRNRS